MGERMNAQERLLERAHNVMRAYCGHHERWASELVNDLIAEIQRLDRHMGFIAELSEQAADGNPGDIPYTQDAIALSNYARTHRFEDES